MTSKGKSWREMGIRKEQILTRCEKTAAFDPALKELVETLYKKIDAEGFWPKQ